ncbi:MAG: CusA/CzcA family heavy metal efflux RND transporter [Verrucomicrobiales bacterium]|jgi:Cu(I)/Ag(I) efflux system membrane protein CusA/SilA|nr:CusA/CzcA family heavy metal efflux RND transporter [Verrucomicrobiales bacterium]
MSTEHESTLIERLTIWSGRNPFLICILVLLGVAYGIHSLQKTPLDAIPDLSDVQVIVYTEWNGRNPTLIEDQITYPISSKFISAPKVKFVRGESIFGKSFVYVIFEDGTDIYWARSRVIEYLNAVRGSLPEGVNPTIGPDATGVGWVYEYALVDESGKNDLAQLRTFQDWTLRYALSSVKGVAEVATMGGYTRQYQINLDPDKLVAYGVTLQDVVDAVKKSNRDVGGKTFEVATTEFYIRGRGYFKNISDIEQVAVKTDASGNPILIKQLGTVTLGGDMRQGLVDFNGKGETVGGVVVMRYGENALDVINGIKKKLKELEPAMPPGVKIVPVYDRSELIKASIKTLQEKLIEESIIVSLVCLVFLWHVRSALVAILMLPVAIILSFILFQHLHLTANIMSLGGIAIAIGAMIDAAIIMIENAHKYLEKAREANGGVDVTGERRIEVILDAAKSVGRPLFFSLLVITVSFIPVFTLEAQEGRLFQPLAFTKTFSMLFAALLSVTLVPVLMLWFIRGKITPEIKNPINRFLIWLYQPLVDLVLKFRWLSIFLALLILGSMAYPIMKLGAEFMPPLNEGSILFMPTATPGIAISEASRVLNIQDRQIMQFPEVETAFGKAGQADTATDPAPLSMFETVIQLKPKEQWRPGMTWDKLLAEMNDRLKMPGMANVFWMPIQTRTQMLTTGFRSNLGIKIFGQNLEEINKIGENIERALTGFPHVRSVFSERATGGRYLDISVKRAALARYGLRVEDVNDAIEMAVGGSTIAQTVEGRERYPISVRYARDYRDDITALGRVLVATSTGAQVPLSELADIHYTFGPPSVRSENGQLVSFVFVDTTASDMVGFVQKAAEQIREQVVFPTGYYMEWAGSFEYFLRAKERLLVIVPFTLLIIFVLIYMNTKSLIRTVIVFLAVPFSLVGAFWLLYLLGYNMSVAVAVGLIALAGIDAETGVVMLMYLDHAYDDRKRRGLMNNVHDLILAVEEGAVHRIRPKMMTVCAILFGLLPILWSTGTGADVMKRIATPMVGGVITSAILELLIYPVIYVLWRGYKFRKQPTSEMPS